MKPLLLPLMLVTLTASAWNAGAEGVTWEIGVAKVDITPSYPVRLAGYASRTNEFKGVAQRVHAQAIALRRGSEPAALLLAVESCGVPGWIRDELAVRLQKAGLLPERFTLCSTHTHSAPWLAGYLPNLFYPPISTDEQASVKRYTEETLAAFEKVCISALAQRQPCKISWAVGTAEFARNRRAAAGPTDHRLPVLFVTAPQGQMLAALATYACHCTTLGGEFNQVCGDWAGFAREHLEKEWPGAVALISIGCGGDANPDPRPGLDLARRHGQALASEVVRVYDKRLPLISGLVCRTSRVELPFASLPSLQEWEKRADQKNHIGQQASQMVLRLKRGERIPAALPYLVQGWAFGQELAMVFLPGEVVVDYALRLGREFQKEKLWVHAYANDVPCYIPSERVLKEGGYEGGGAMVYYDLPGQFVPGIEDLIVRAVHDVLPKEFVSTQKPQSPGN